MRKRTIAIILVIILVAGVSYYYKDITEYLFEGNRSMFISEGVEVASLRELSDTVTYPVPDGSHTIKFTLFIDDENTIRGVKGIDTTDPSHQPNVNEFSEGVFMVIEGKKLSELEGVDKVGGASLTTDAFNEALGNMKTNG